MTYHLCRTPKEVLALTSQWDIDSATRIIESGPIIVELKSPTSAEYLPVSDCKALSPKYDHWLEAVGLLNPLIIHI